MNKYKRKFDDVGEQGYHGGHWYEGRLHGHWNSETQNGARFGGRRGGGRDVNNGGGGGVQGENISKTTPPHQDVQKNRGGGHNGREGGRLEYTERWIGVMGKHP